MDVVAICSTRYGGCGHVGDVQEWDDAFDDGLDVSKIICFSLRTTISMI